MEPDSRRNKQTSQHYCHFHPSVETGVSCNKCGEYICPKDMVQTPVGIRCKQCARVRKMPTFDVSPVYYIRASVAGLGIGVVIGIVWGYLILFLVLFLGGFFLLPWIISLGVGYILGEIVSQVTNRKRGTGLATIVTVSMAIAVIASSFVIGFGFFLGNPFGLIILAGAFYVAISRVR